ncbi:MAG: Uma2 family endonuclease [Isosphaeraceae bacterium]
MAATVLLEPTDVSALTEIELPDDEQLYEFVDGRRIETPAMSYHAALVGTELGGDLIVHVRQQTPRPGHIAIEALFRIPLRKDASRKRRPDIAFVSSERWPLDRPTSRTDDAWEVVPDLVVEVVSPTDSAEGLLEKVREYFQAGVRLAWLVYPSQRCIHVFEAWNRIRVVTESDTLDASDVLPEFRLPLARLFESIGPVADEEA